MRKLSALLLTGALLASVAFQPALADDWRRHGEYHHYHDHDYDYWRAGHWFNGFHEGRAGWWWIAGGYWYYYPAPVYPYPDPFTPPTVVVETSPVPAGMQTYYYCASPTGYYPQVPQCAVTWQRIVSATPPSVVVPQAPQAVPAPSPKIIVPVGNQQDIDLRQLNEYAAKLQTIDYQDSHVRSKLKELGKQVEAFRQTLYKRDYNAMGLLKNADDLKKHIDDQREWLSKHKGTVPPASMLLVSPSAAVTTAPPSATAVPPGTAITFPPPPQ